ncbi:MAG: DegT/DnrJ/EryC1/StrS family aminotransferase [Lachnospiraceae bacterium]|nr:DegT/DnrJ/EryC1/StrS family aminotransferase [Lachnospiraceae bacterium]
MSKDILVTRSSMPDFDEYTNEIKELWDSHWLTNHGVKARELKEQLKKYLQTDNLELTVNGHMALELILTALKLPAGSEVITTPFTFVSTTHSIVRCGLKPVFCDINPDTYTIDVDKIESLITDKTSAILPVHVYGNICDDDAISKIASKHGLKVIYDAAHAFGVNYKGTPVSCLGDASIFSFHATKVYNTIEGGAITFKDPSLSRVIEEIRDFGIHDEESIPYVGPNAKMNEFAAAMGICNLRHVNSEIEKRGKVVEAYIKGLSGIEGVKLNPVFTTSIESSMQTLNYAYFPVLFTDEYRMSRDEIFAELSNNGIKSRKYFYPLTNEIEAYKGIFDSGSTPIALDISKRVLTLPMYADLEISDVERICKIIAG